MTPSFESDGSIQHAELMRWRKTERARLLQDRLAIGSDERRSHVERIAAGLDGFIGDVAGLTISFYWPFRAEPDLHAWAERVWARGGTCVLPVVIEKSAPLVFRKWRRGDPLERGIWNIPIPVAGPAGVEVIPDVVIAPVVGFDRACYRLGYGGGYFDRTLAVMSSRPQVIGVGYSQFQIPTIYPEPHDIPMNVIVTEHGIVRPAL